MRLTRLALLVVFMAGIGLSGCRREPEKPTVPNPPTSPKPNPTAMRSGAAPSDGLAHVPT